MPRPYWEAKNPYCRRSKLTKAQFEKVSYFYFLEITSGWSRHTCAELLLAGEEGSKLSRQSISLYFDAMGDFLWEHVVVAADPRYADKTRLDGLFAYIYGPADTLTEQYDLVEAFLRSVPLTETKAGSGKSDRFQRNVLIELLKRRSEVTRGLAGGQLHREVARAVFVCAAIEASGMKLKSIDDLFAYPRIKEIARLAWTILLDTLERHPLDRVD